MILLVMAALMVLSIVAVPLTSWFASRGDAAQPEPMDTADEGFAEPFALTIDPEATYHATFETDEGDIVIELDPEGAPIATNNLVNLARSGFYDGVIFHRVVEGFMIQGGDPTGTGTGGPGYNIEDEFAVAEATFEAEGGYPRGALAMANTGAPNSSGSQFFIMHADYPLPPQYTLFGHVIDGIEVVDAIATAEVLTDQPERPVDPVVIRTITIAES